MVENPEMSRLPWTIRVDQMFHQGFPKRKAGGPEGVGSRSDSGRQVDVTAERGPEPRHAGGL